jgi:hypothetical protein
LKRTKVDPRENREQQIVVGGLIALDVIAVIQMLGMPSLDYWLTLSLYLFAVSIPLLSLCALTAARDSASAWRAEIWYNDWADIVGRSAAIVAGTLVFVHLSRKAAMLFIGLILLGILALTHYTGVSRRINKPRGQ